MTIDLTKTSGTSPPLYHFTTSAHLPRILQSGELHAMKVTPELLAYEASLYPFASKAPALRPSFELVDATTNPNRERTATVEYNREFGGSDFFDDGDMAIVRFTLEADDFTPWKQLCEAVGYKPEWIKSLAATARNRGSDPRQWFSRVEPLPLSRVVAIHTQDIFNGRDEWLPLDKDAVSYYTCGDDPRIMGVDIGKVCFWSAQSFRDGRDAYAPLKVTEARPSGAGVGLPDPGHAVIGTNLKTGETASSHVRRWPDVREEKKKPAPLAVLANPNSKPDPLADIASAFVKATPTPSPRRAEPGPATPNAQRMTTSVRYVITEDTFRRYDPDDVTAEKAELIAADMWKLPHGDEPYTLRMSMFAISEFMNRFADSDAEADARWKAAKREAVDLGREQWLDYDMRGDELIGLTRVFREHIPGNVDKRWYIENTATDLSDIRETEGLDPDSRQAWWEKGNWLNQRFVDVGMPGKELIAEGLLDILMLALMDSSVVQERTPSAPRSQAFAPGGWLYSKELDVQEVTIRCSGFYRTSGERGEATGRTVKMHRRRGHIRTYHRGLPNQFTGYIDPVWINAIAGVEPPPVVYTVRASA
jgi:hypothetical protein